MKTIEEIKQIVISWASSLPFTVRVHLFGSFLKGHSEPSDIDLAVEFLEAFYLYKNEQRYPESLWYEFHEQWENDLSEKLSMKVDLQLSDLSAKHIRQYLEEASLLLYTSEGKAYES